jgi:hypothetical protein
LALAAMLSPGLFDGPALARQPGTGGSGGPPNDDCADRIEIGNGQTPFTTVDATTDGLSPCGDLGSDIWYGYVAREGGFISIDTCGSDFDTVVAVYNGCNCPPGTLLVCNDDAIDGPCAGTLQSAVQLPVVAGNCYTIQVGGFRGLQGDGLLAITIQPACDEDVSDDCVVDVLDLLMVILGWSPIDDPLADVNGDGVVDVLDLVAVIVGWGPCNEACLPNCPGSGDCLEPHGTPGCEDESCCTTVCAADPFCCEVQWDRICADAARAICDQPPPGPCEDPFTCGAEISFCNDGVCICVATFDGTTVCLDPDTPCGTPCPDGTCPDGFTCVVDTCCDLTTCIPDEFVCVTAAARPPVEPAAPTVIGAAADRE